MTSEPLETIVDDNDRMANHKTEEKSGFHFLLAPLFIGALAFGALASPWYWEGQYAHRTAYNPAVYSQESKIVY